MEIRQLRSFLQIVAAGNFSRAAVDLHLSQPALTHQMQSLEAELGTPLLERGTRQVHLTPQGKAFLAYAQRIVALADESRHALQAMVEGAGRLSLGIGTTNIVCRLPDWLQKFRTKLPKVEISVRTGSSVEVMEAVLNDKVDLGLVTSPVPDRRLVAYPLFKDEILLLGSRKQTLPGNTWTDLHTAPFLLFPQGTGFRLYIDDLFRRIGIEPNVILELDNIEGIKKLVEMGMGFSFLPRIAVEAELTQGVLIQYQPAPQMKLFRTSSLVMRKDKYWFPAFTQFMHLMSQEYPAAGIPLMPEKDRT